MKFFEILGSCIKSRIMLFVIQPGYERRKRSRLELGWVHDRVSNRFQGNRENGRNQFRNGHYYAGWFAIPIYP